MTTHSFSSLANSRKLPANLPFPVYPIHIPSPRRKPGECACIRLHERQGFEFLFHDGPFIFGVYKEAIVQSAGYDKRGAQEVTKLSRDNDSPFIVDAMLKLPMNIRHSTLNPDSPLCTTFHHFRIIDSASRIKYLLTSICFWNFLSEHSAQKPPFIPLGDGKEVCK